MRQIHNAKFSAVPCSGNGIINPAARSITQKDGYFPAFPAFFKLSVCTANIITSTLTIMPAI
jgi:hypothetical protein